MRIAVIDGQGGGIGSLLVKRLREEFRDHIDILALGTNSAATTSMMNARANRGATGENAISWNIKKVDIIVGPLSIVLANGMCGELTPKMAEAISSSDAKKILLPINQEGVEVVGIEREPLPHLIEKVIKYIKHLSFSEV